MKTGRQRKFKRHVWKRSENIVDSFAFAWDQFNKNLDREMSLVFPGKCTVRKVKRGHIEEIKLNIFRKPINKSGTPGGTRKPTMSVIAKIRDSSRSLSERIGSLAMWWR